VSECFFVVIAYWYLDCPKEVIVCRCAYG